MTEELDDRNRPRTDPRTRGGVRAPAAAGPSTQPPPRFGWDGYAYREVWDGLRQSIGFTDETYNEVLEANFSHESTRSGAPLYHCSVCGNKIPRKADSRVHARRTGETEYVDVDHREGIIAYVARKTDAYDFVADLGNGWQRPFQAHLREEARAAANNPRNLSVMCKGHNRAKSGRSASRAMDNLGPSWTGEPVPPTDAGSAYSQVMSPYGAASAPAQGYAQPAYPINFGAPANQEYNIEVRAPRHRR